MATQAQDSSCDKPPDSAEQDALLTASKVAACTRCLQPGSKALSSLCPVAMPLRRRSSVPCRRNCGCKAPVRGFDRSQIGIGRRADPSTRTNLFSVVSPKSAQQRSLAAINDSSNDSVLIFPRTFSNHSRPSCNLKALLPSPWKRGRVLASSYFASIDVICEAK